MTLDATVDTTISFIDDLTDAKLLLDIGASDTLWDGILETLINHSAAFMESYTERKLKSRTHTDVLVNGDGFTQVQLPEWPVSSVSSLVVSSSRAFSGTTALVIWDQTGDLGTDDVILHGDTGILERVDGNSFPRGTNVIKVTYVAGYTGGDGGTGWRFRQAQSRILGQIFSAVGRDPNLTSQSVAGISSSFLSGTGPFSGKFSAVLPDVREVLDAARRPMEHGGVLS